MEIDEKVRVWIYHLRPERAEGILEKNRGFESFQLFNGELSQSEDILEKK